MKRRKKQAAPGKPRVRRTGKAKPGGLEQTDSLRALHRAVYGPEPDPLGSLVQQAGWAGLDGDMVWARRLMDEARRDGLDVSAGWSAYETGRLRPDEVVR